MAKLLWAPSDETVRTANLSRYMEWLREKKGLSFDNYSSLWNWSVSERSSFWISIIEYFGVVFDGKTEPAFTNDPMPHTKWFPELRLNYAEQVFNAASNDRPAIIARSESGPMREIQWSELKRETSSLQHRLRSAGVTRGDTVAGYLPCIPEATVSLLATAGLGAIWSSCSPDFGTQAVIDRFAQIQPRVLIASETYQYNGKTFDKRDVIRELLQAIPSIRLVVIIGEQLSPEQDVESVTWSSIMEESASELHFERVPFMHPLWILFSSGTTGLPKAITHSHGGILLEQLKYGAFHNDYKSGEKCFWYTTTGWMMWNYIHGSLLAGATMVLYDGSPGYPDLNALWRFVEEAGITHFGTSASFILANIKAGISPGDNFDLSSIRSIGSTGSTLPEEGFKWIYERVGKNIWLTSMSGGTDVCSAFVGGNPLWPVYSGEIQCRALGCNLHAWDEEGKSLLDEEGEMVITSPMPSMPVFFWNDKDFERYRESYFEMFPGAWRHGDWIRITKHEGVVIYGRSDATLNRGGIRIGTSEIYRAVDRVDEVRDSLVVCVEKSNGDFWMPLFVTLKDGVDLDESLIKKINTTIRQAYTPRHVPDEVITVRDIPYTISGKKTETPVKKIIMGKDPSKVVNAGSLRNPQSLTEFVAFRSRLGN